MISVKIPERILDFLTIFPLIIPTKKNDTLTEIVEKIKASEFGSIPIIIKIINGINGISPIKLNPTNVLKELSTGFFHPQLILILLSSLYLPKLFSLM